MLTRGNALRSCSFCGRSEKAVHRLVAGPGGVHVCDGCADLFSARLAAQSEQRVTCSFCGRSFAGASDTVSGPAGATICAECVELARHIMQEEIARAEGSEKDVSAGRRKAPADAQSAWYAEQLDTPDRRTFWGS